jgi:hypothetical protein
MPEQDKESYSVHFAMFAAKLEHHLLNHGVACNDADLIIEEISVIFFDKLNNPGKIIPGLFKKREPSQLFVDSAFQAMEKYIPEARNTFGSQKEIESCLR